MPEENDNKWFRWVPHIIRHDFLRKVTALIFALMVFYIVSYKVGKTMTFRNVPVNIVLPAELINMGSTMPTVDVTLRGNERWLNRVSPNDIKIRAEADTSKFIPGQLYTIKIPVDEIRTPLGVKVAGLDKNEVSVMLAQRISKPVPIKPEFKDKKNLPRDYAVGNVKINPTTAMITGAKNIVESLNEISTEPIPLDTNTMESFEYPVKLAGNIGITTTPDTVTASVEIIKEYLSKTFESLPIRMMNGMETAKFAVEFSSTPHVNVTISGMRGKIMSMRSEQIRPYIDVSGLDKAGVYTVDVSCWVDVKDATVVAIYPKQVQVQLTRK